MKKDVNPAILYAFDIIVESAEKANLLPGTDCFPDIGEGDILLFSYLGGKMGDSGRETSVVGRPQLYTFASGGE